MAWFSELKLKQTISAGARSVSVTREKNFNFASLHILPLACCNHPPFSLTNVKCSKCQSEYWMHSAQHSVALKTSLVTIVKNITSVQQYRGGRSCPTMIMAILPTVLPPITASFYFAATNLPNNCWRQKKTCLGQVCMEIEIERAVDWKLQICKFGETKLLHRARFGGCLAEEMVKIREYSLVLSPSTSDGVILKTHSIFEL